MGKDQELLEAARNGNIPVVEKILNQRAKRSGPLASLRRGPGANVQDSSGYSALHHAALNGHREIVHLLLSHEASTNIVDVKGSSPLHLAAWTGNVDIVRLLLNQGPSVPNINLTTKDNETALHCAAHFGHTEVVAHLLEHRCDASIRNAREETALDLAAQYGRLDTVELLVRTHPELIRPYARGECPPLLFPHTPLHLASRNGHKAVVAVLLSAGLDVNVRTGGGTALHEAALCGKVEVVRTLLDEGVDLAIRDSHHNTVMDLLGQFPAHVTHDITAIIKKHRGLSGPGDADVEENGHNPLPPIPVPDPTLGSPYENVRSSQRSSHHSRVPPGVDSSSPGTSPTHWDFYHHHAKTRGGPEDRRISGTSAMSITSDSSVYQTPPYPKSIMESSFRSEELPMYYSRDPDQMSVSSTTSSTGGRGGRGLEPSPGSTSSTGGPSPRDRRFVGPDMSPGVYMTMGPGPGYTHQSHRSHSPGSTSKVSPTPPKKPPRRNLSVSPTHPAHLMTMSADGSSLGPGDNNYEYLFLARSGVRSHSDLEELQGIGTQTLGGRREAMLRRGRSQDQYVDMKVRQSFLDAGESFQFRKDMEEDNTLTRKHILNQPIAITASFGNYAIRTTNPRRKLRRHNNDKNYENYEPTHRIEVSKEFMNSVAIEPIFVSNAYITLKSSQESLLDEKREDRGRKLKIQPTSPTHYQQPPTPDHPPPSAMQAEKSIHERIRPLSQEYKRRSRDIETETDEDLLLFPSLEDASSGSLSSSVSLSDKSVSTDNNVEEFVGDAPFAGKFGNDVKLFALQLCNSGTVEDNLIFSSCALPSVGKTDKIANVITTDIVQPGSTGTSRNEGGTNYFASSTTDKFDTQNRLHRNVTFDNLSEPKQDLVFERSYTNVELGCECKKQGDMFQFDRSYSNVEIGSNSLANKECYKKSGGKVNFDRSYSNVESCSDSLTVNEDTLKKSRCLPFVNEVNSECIDSNVESDCPLVGEDTLKTDRGSKSHVQVHSEAVYSNVQYDLPLVGKKDNLKADQGSKSDVQVHSESVNSNVQYDLSLVSKKDNLKVDQGSKSHIQVHSEAVYCNLEPDLPLAGKDDTLKAQRGSKSHIQVHSEAVYSDLEPEFPLTGKDDTLKAERGSKSHTQVHSEAVYNNVLPDLPVAAGKNDTLKANRGSKSLDKDHSEGVYSNVEPDLPLAGKEDVKIDRCLNIGNITHSNTLNTSLEPYNDTLAGREHILKADGYTKPGDLFNLDKSNTRIDSSSDNIQDTENILETDILCSKPGDTFHFNRSYSIVDFGSNLGSEVVHDVSNSNIELGNACFASKEGTCTRQCNQARLVRGVVEPAGQDESTTDKEGTLAVDLCTKQCDKDQLVRFQGDAQHFPTKSDALDPNINQASVGKVDREATCAGNCDGSNLTALLQKTRTLKI